MRASRLSAAISAAALCVLVAFPSTARADDTPRAPAIARAYTTWTTTLADADCDGAKVATLYSPNAILLATFESYVAGRPAITKYFDSLTCKPNLTVATTRITSVRRGPMGYATGLYTFSYDNADGTKTKVPARFTFVFELVGGRWVIVNHHSSQDPQTH